MTDRNKVAKDVMAASTEGKLPMKVQVDDLKRDYSKISDRLSRAGVRSEIGMSTEKGTNLIWFWNKK